ncbi:unnamed protein product [Arabis nemorensis]|uniref:Uncharacterized protein n=1 Tax=Arabis nemorensis TaxID=586526 RepID=A0A565CME2_9BRAS|nr:unnamed protein product [Arabis nemorensis]
MGLGPYFMIRNDIVITNRYSKEHIFLHYRLLTSVFRWRRQVQVSSTDSFSSLSVSSARNVVGVLYPNSASGNIIEHLVCLK